MSITRRDFLKWTGAAGVATLLPPIFDREMKAFAALAPGEHYFLPTESRYSMCGTCDSNCGVILQLVDGVIREINGNPADVFGCQGKICVKGQSAIRNVYDPDVLKTPMIRTNPAKGMEQDPGFTPISWDEAYAIIAEKMVEAKNAEGCGPRSILCLERPNEMGRYLVDPLGTPNQTCHVDTCYLDQDATWIATFKKGKSRTFETEKSTYILSFGYDIPGKSKMAQLRSFLTAWDNGAKVVVFDPRLSTTANMADEWFAIKPGTDLAVALAMIYVIITENRYDAAYVGSYCYGFDYLEDHIVAEGYTPEWSESISGIPAGEIARIAREFAAADHPLIPTYKRDAAGPVYVNSFQLNRALMILNALVGAIESEGGFWWPRTPATPPALLGFGGTTAAYQPVDGLERVDGQHMFPFTNTMFGTSGGTGFKSKGVMAHLAEGLARAKAGIPFPDGTPSYPVKVIFSGHYNVNTFPDRNHIVDELSNPDIFIAATDNVLSNLGCLADIVLPTTWWPMDKDTFGTTDQHEIRGRFFLKDGIGPTFQKKGVGGVYKGLFDKLRAAGYWGDPVDPATPNYAVDTGALVKERMRRFGIANMGLPDTSLWSDTVNWLKANGGIWHNPNAPTPNLVLGTPSKKIELYSQALDANGHEPLPTWHEKLVERTSEDEFYLVTHHNPFHRMCKNQNDPLIMDLQPENFLHMHPDAAARFRVKTGDYVEVLGQTGKILEMRVKVIQGIRPDTVMTEHGYGHYSVGLSVARGKGVNEGDLMPDRTLQDSLDRYEYNPGMASAIGDTVVRILGKA
jgi:thiosulfate reductase / polysulfide reductase chain A